VAVADKLRFALQVITAYPPITCSDWLSRNLYLRRLDSLGFYSVHPLLVTHDHAY
jgi:hypothetical protein